MKKQVVFILFTILFSNKILGQIDSLIINQDPKLLNNEGFNQLEYNSNNLMNNLNSFNNTLPKEMVLENSNDLKNNYSFLKFCKSKNIDIKYPINSTTF